MLDRLYIYIFYLYLNNNGYTQPTLHFALEESVTLEVSNERNNDEKL